MEGGRRADHQLWELVCADRDGNAFAELYHRHSARIHAHLLQRTGAAEAEDLTAEVFTTAWRTNTTVYFDPVAGMLPWLLVCANNLLRNQQRTLRRARRALGRIGMPSAATEPDIADTVVESTERDRIRGVLRSVLAELSESERDIVQLCVVQGLAPTTVARAMDRPPGTIRSQLSRALVKARAAYLDRVHETTSASIGEKS